MKKFRLPIFMVLAIALLCQTPLLGQQNNQADKAVVIQKVTTDDGSTIIKKKRLEKGQSTQDYLDALGFENAEGQSVEITIIEDGKKEQIVKSDEGETIFLFRNGNSKHKIVMEGYDMEELEEQMEKMQEMLDEKMDQHSHQFQHQHKNGSNYSYSYDYKYDYHYGHHDNPNVRSDRPLLGIYPDYTREGILINGLVDGGGAVAAGIREGDIITSMNGIEMSDETDLVTELSKYEAGETVTLNYLRDGQTFTTQSTLSARKGNSKKWRDPCKVFIGVRLNGTQILGIIPGTSATKMDLQSGDRIIAMDGNPINTLSQLTSERDSHDPGDYFILTVLRDNLELRTEGQFKTCDEENPTPVEQEIIEEIVETTPEVKNEIEEIKFEELKLFPNPTFGNLNVQFSGEAIPTTFTITDVTGKTIFTDKVPNFNGQYQRQVDVRSAVPGNLILTVQQGEKVYSKQAVLMARA